MSDQKLRALQRRFRETGAVGDEAAWLAERVRVGTLEPEALALCAHLGHAAAGPVREPALFTTSWAFEQATLGGPALSWSRHLQDSFGEVGLKGLTRITPALAGELAREWKENLGDPFPLTLCAALRGGREEVLRISRIGGPPLRERLERTWDCQIETGPERACVPSFCAAIVSWAEGTPLLIDGFLRELLLNVLGPDASSVLALKERLRDLLVADLLR